MSAVIRLTIENCSECPYVRKKRVWTDDSWDEIYDYFCSISNKKVAAYMEWFDKMPDVPKDCQIRE